MQPIVTLTMNPALDISTEVVDEAIGIIREQCAVVARDVGPGRAA